MPLTSNDLFALLPIFIVTVTAVSVMLVAEARVRRGHLVGPPARGYATCFLRLRWSGLSLGRGAIEFVGEQDIREHRPAYKSEMALPRLAILLQYICSRDVARHEIGRELDAIRF